MCAPTCKCCSRVDVANAQDGVEDDFEEGGDCVDRVCGASAVTAQGMVSSPLKLIPVLSTCRREGPAFAFAIVVVGDG